MKKLVKKNDENLEILKNENKDLKIKLQEFYRISQQNMEYKSDISLLKIENNSLKKISEDIKDKYESLRDVDSPVKEISQMKDEESIKTK